MCNVCNGQESLNMLYTPFRLRVINRKIYLERFDSYAEEWNPQPHAVVKIEYCPACGENLTPLEERYFRIQRFTINSKLPSLNEYIKLCTTNRFKANTFKKTTEEMIQYEVLKDKIKPVEKPIILYCTWHEKTKRRDKDNVISAKKFILDALQKAQIIKNDNPTWVIDCKDEVVYDGTQKVIVELREQK